MSSPSITEIAQPLPILNDDNYPSAPTITTQITISTPTLRCDIQSTAEGETILYSNKEPKYFYQEPFKQNITFPLQNQYKKPLWKLTNRDWHGMTFNYQHLIITLSTTPPRFSFTFNSNKYHWQTESHSASYSLKCYETEAKKLIAQLDQEQFVLDIPSSSSVQTVTLTAVTTAIEEHTNTNPFRKSATIMEDDPFTSFILLSGLLINDHIKLLLKSLGGGPDALQMIMNPHLEEEEDDDIASLSSVRHYAGHKSLVDNDGDNRWSSSAQSFKSIELDPGVWRCWWGYKFWWSWLPCCMPGGYCDRACVKIRHRRHSTAKLSKQGWQQQHY